jgi:CBS domain-containing protein
MSEIGATLEDIPSRLDFDHAQANLYAAAREGLERPLHLARRRGGRSRSRSCSTSSCRSRRRGWTARGRRAEDSARYLGIIDQRVRTMRTGSRWMLQSLAGMKERGSLGERLTALVAATIARQKTDRVVSDWERARLDENDSARTGYQKVSQYMTTDIFTVQPDDPVELVAELMGWERIRHVPVEDGRARSSVSSRTAP